jgi:Zn-dependent peptidase ImmA (M78 family)
MDVHGMTVPARSRLQIRELASLLREMSRPVLGGFGDSFPIVDVAELVLPELLDDYVFEVRTVSEMGDDHGLTIPSKNNIRIREDIYERALEGRGRDRLTIAHEIGHLLMHDTARFARTAPGQTIPAYRSPEWQANCFGAELLVFPEGLTRRHRAVDVAALRGVSVDAATIQLEHYVKGGLVR